MSRWELRIAEKRDGYEIVTPEGEVVDKITIREAATNPNEVFSERIACAQGTYRVVRFARILRELQRADGVWFDSGVGSE